MSKICKICGYENDDADILCKKCGGYIKITKAHKFLFFGIASLLMGGVFTNTPLIILLLLAPVFIIISIILGVKDVTKHADISKSNLTTQAELEQQKRRNESKYRIYNYSHEKLLSKDKHQTTTSKNKEHYSVNYTVNTNERLDPYEKYNLRSEKDFSEIKLEEYRKEHQSEYISRLKMEFFEEYQKEPNFENCKQVIFAINEDDFDYNNVYNEYEHQDEREYFVFNRKWAFFDFNDDIKKYKLIICENKKFYTECYIENISTKTKKLLNFIKSNPDKIEFYEAELKNQEKTLKTGTKIKCSNCGYIYFSDNKKCPNCKYLTSDTIEENYEQ